MSGKCWCFTINNPEKKPEELVAASKFSIYSLEVGENGTEHYQGYVQMKKQCRLSAMSKLCPRAHFEQAKGTPAQNVAYCSKKPIAGPWVTGEIVKQGQRSDLEEVGQKVLDGAKLSDIAKEHISTYCRYHKGLQALKNVTIKPRDEVTECVVIYGPTGVGKTTDVKKMYPDAYWKMNGEWWDGYEQQEVVVLDEFYGWLPFAVLLRLLDGTPLKVPTKGSFVEFTAKMVVILSNKPPSQWYKDEYLPSLYRRLSKISNKISFTTIYDVKDDFK